MHLEGRYSYIPKEEINVSNKNSEKAVFGILKCALYILSFLYLCVSFNEISEV